jgi:hypothetical protein
MYEPEEDHEEIEEEEIEDCATAEFKYNGQITKQCLILYQWKLKEGIMCGIKRDFDDKRVEIRGGKRKVELGEGIE